MQQGWKCPCCETVHSPLVMACTCKSGAQNRSVHYGVAYDDRWAVPRNAFYRGSVILGCGKPTMNAGQYQVTRDWNEVTCRRCMRSRAVAAGPVPQTCGISGPPHQRMAIIAAAPEPPEEGMPIIASLVFVNHTDPMWTFPPPDAEEV